VGVEVGTACQEVGGVEKVEKGREMSRDVARREDSFLAARRHQPGFYTRGGVMDRLMLALRVERRHTAPQLHISNANRRI
jgi:hypothetical protein